MEIIEKQVEKVKEVPNDMYYGDHRYNRNINGKANAGLALGIVGTALGAWSLWGNKSSLFGNRGGNLDGANININGVGAFSGIHTPTSFQVYEKGCNDALALTNTIWRLKVDGLEKNAMAREIDVNEKFKLYKSQIDADFGLYKTTRDNFDTLNAKITDLETKVAVNAAIRPYQDKLIQCEIDKAFTAGINYTDRKTCRMITGQLVLPAKPVVEGLGSYHPCCTAAIEEK